MRAVAAFRNSQKRQRYYQESIEVINDELVYSEFGILIPFSEHEKLRFGGVVERTIQRNPFGEYKDLPVENITFDQAVYELSEFAQVSKSSEKFRAIILENQTQIGYLVKLNNVFHYPSRQSVLAELFDEGCEISTRKATYKLVKRIVGEIDKEKFPKEIYNSKMKICLNEREAEFIEALKRGFDEDMEVIAGWNEDTFFVKNNTNDSEYRVELVTIDGKIYAECECPDYSFKKRLCKHISQVLLESLLNKKPILTFYGDKQL